MSLKAILDSIKQIEGLPTSAVADLVAEVAVLSKTNEELEAKYNQASKKAETLEKQIGEITARYKDLPDPDSIKAMQEVSSKYKDVNVEELMAQAEQLTALKEQYGKEVAEMQSKLDKTQSTVKAKDTEHSKLQAMLDGLQKSYEKTQADLAAIREEKEKERQRADRIQAETALSKMLDAVEVDPRRKAGAEALFKLQGLTLQRDEDGKEVVLVGENPVEQVIKAWSESEDGKAYIRQKRSTGGESSAAINSGAAQPSSAAAEEGFYYKDLTGVKQLNYTKVAAGIAANDQVALSVARKEGILVDAAVGAS